MTPSPQKIESPDTPGRFRQADREAVRHHWLDRNVPWPSPESVETSNWWILVLMLLLRAALGGGGSAPPAAGGRAGRRPPVGLGLGPGEDGATLGSRKRRSSHLLG